MARRLALTLLCTALAGSLGVSAAKGRCKPEPPINDEAPLRNGGFEDGTNPFTYSKDSEVRGEVIAPGYNSEYLFRSFNLIDNNLLEMYQDVRTSGGLNYRCDYNWWFDTYYDYNDYVPYLRIFQNDDPEAIGNRYPTGKGQTGTWMSGRFYFTSSASGRDRIWIDVASPQPKEEGDNNFQFDNLNCYQV